jgi:WD40 repeat protein
VNPKWLLGGTWGGQVVIWENKKKTPMNRTSLSKGHTQPVFTIRTHTTPGRAPQIVSLSTDGHLCVWSDNNLHEPTLEREIRASGKADDITTTCFAFAGKDGGTYVIGSDEGKVYKARVHDEKVAAIYEEIKAHDAPIAAIEWHPGQVCHSPISFH